MTLKGPLKNRSVIFLTTQKTWNYKFSMVVEHLMLAIHWLVSVLQAWWHFFFFNLKWFTLNLKHFYKNLCMQESHPLLKLHEVPTTDSKFEYSEARQRCMSPTSCDGGRWGWENSLPKMRGRHPVWMLFKHIYNFWRFIESCQCDSPWNELHKIPLKVN